MQEAPELYLYRRINETAFKDDPLPLLPVSSIRNPDKHYAGVTVAIKGEPQEIVINLAHINGIDAYISTLVHEMIHVYCAIKGIPHFADGHHLQGFIDEADKRGLIFSEEPYINLFYLEPEELLPDGSDGSDTPTR